MTIRQNSFIAGEMISRRQMLDMGLPIGNPILPPFNRKEMPFAPIAGAFAAAGTAIAAGGAMAIAGAVLNLVAVSAMYVGVAMTVTGMITGDKGLMKIGAIVGLAGGLGSLAIGGVASLAAGGQFAMGTAGIESMNAANAAAATAQSQVALGAAAGNLANVTPTSLVNVTTPTATTGLTNGLNAITPQSITMAGQTGTGLIGQVGAGGLNAAGGSALNAIGTSSATNLAGAAGAAGATGGGFFSNLMSSMTPKDYLIGGGMAVQGASSMVQKGIESDFGVKKAQLGLDKTAQDKELAAKQSEAANAYIQNLNQPTNLNVRNLTGSQV